MTIYCLMTECLMTSSHLLANGCSEEPTALCDGRDWPLLLAGVQLLEPIAVQWLARFRDHVNDVIDEDPPPTRHVLPVALHGADDDVTAHA